LPPRVLLVASEAIPLIKTGGLADVVSAMADALHQRGVEVTLLMPAYPAALAVLAARGDVREVARLSALPCGEARLLHGRMGSNGVPVLLFDCAGFRARGSNPYVDADGREYADNPLCFASLALAAVHICAGKTAWPVPHVVHANDWHAALIPAFLRTAGIGHVGTVLTIHNLAFQGNYPLEIGPSIGLPESMIGPDGAEFWGRLSFLKAGIRYADRISIVSRSYAREVLTPRFGCGMEGVLNQRRDALVPIANGVDVELWNPACDPLIARRFSADDRRNKAHCKRALLRLFGLPVVPRAPLLALGSRITHQKMADVALEALPRLLERQPRLQVVVLGCGDHEYEAGFRALAEQHRGRLGVYIGYDEQRAHALHAGADMLLHGTRFEPFGLTPIYAMRYGTVPIASRVGGIIDTVVDAGNLDAPTSGACGVLFDGEHADDLLAAVERALGLHAQAEVWSALQRNAMRGDFSWEQPVRRYLDLYAEIAAPETRALFAAAGEAMPDAPAVGAADMQAPAVATA
jgi:starch synthase